MSGIKTLTWKLGKMRKAREWVVTCTDKGNFIVQADGAIGSFEFPTGKGKLCVKGEYFIHLAIAEPFQFPADFVTAAMAVVVRPGQSIGPGCTYAGTTEI